MKKRKFKIAVIGAVNIDICGKPDTDLVMEDSNPGTVSYSIGGVGFNIARNLSLLGCEISFISALGKDSYLEDIRREAEQYGISLDKSRILENEKNSCYLYITDKNGDMAVAVNDMGINKFMTADFLKELIPFINSCDGALIDTNLTKETIDFLCQSIRVPIFADCVSASKVSKIKASIGKLTALKPNRIEAEELTGIKIDSISDAQRAAEQLLSTGLSRVYITLGEAGVFSSQKSDTCFMKPLCTEGELVNTSGAGDAFFASAVKACLDNKSLEESTVIGLRGARSVCLVKESINKNILKYTEKED